MLLLELYLTYLKIGLFAMGGGYATLPLIEQYVILEKHWIDISMMTDIVSVSQMTPGPIALNAATFVGSIVYSIPGSIVATVSVITPQIIILLIGLKYVNFKNVYISKALNGITMAVYVFISFAAYSLIQDSLFINFEKLIPSYRAILVFIISSILYIKKVDIIKIIMLNILLTTISIPILNYLDLFKIITV